MDKIIKERRKKQTINHLIYSGSIIVVGAPARDALRRQWFSSWHRNRCGYFGRITARNTWETSASSAYFWQWHVVMHVESPDLRPDIVVHAFALNCWNWCPAVRPADPMAPHPPHTICVCPWQFCRAWRRQCMFDLELSTSLRRSTLTPSWWFRPAEDPTKMTRNRCSLLPAMTWASQSPNRFYCNQIVMC